MFSIVYIEKVLVDMVLKLYGFMYYVLRLKKNKKALNDSTQDQGFDIQYFVYNYVN